jgi:LysM repeat protein
MATITIQKGQTLSGIAKEQGTTVDALLKANPSIKNPNLIYAGSALNLPEAPKPTPVAPGASGSPQPAPVTPSSTVIVDSIDGVVRRRARTHVLEEVGERVPALADLDATAAV